MADSLQIDLPVSVERVEEAFYLVDATGLPITLWSVTELEESARAINAYDKVVAQRDALTEALKMAGVYLGLWPPAAKSMQVRHYAELSEKITDTIALVEASQ